MKLFEKLAKINSVSGNEKEMKSFIAEEARSFATKYMRIISEILSALWVREKKK